MSKKYGLDFGTTNSAIAIEENGVGKVLPIDNIASDPRVVRSMLYLNHREITYREGIPPARITLGNFESGDIIYKGEFNPLIGEAAVEKYMEENKNRKPGVTRKIYTGRWVTIDRPAEGPKPDPVREYYEETDFGVGRLLQALKTALKSPYYKGTTIFGKYFTLEDLIETYIKEIKKRADEVVGEKIEEVVCGRPVHFMMDEARDKAAQDRLEAALKLSGFKKISFVYEPVAAAQQYIAHSGKQAELVFVFDFGGGTLDTAIVKGGEVLAADGVYIGGDLLNADIMKAKLWSYFGSNSYYGEQSQQIPFHIYEGLGSWFALPNLNNPDMMNRLDRLLYKNSNPEALKRLMYLIKANLGFDLYEAIEKAKKELSFNDEAYIKFSNGPIAIDQHITREEFEEIIKERVEDIRHVVLRTLKSAKIGPDEISVVVRTGGSSLILVFEKMLVDIFGPKKIQQFETFTSIAAGLAL